MDIKQMVTFVGIELFAKTEVNLIQILLNALIFVMLIVLVLVMMKQYVQVVNQVSIYLLIKNHVIVLMLMVFNYIYHKMVNVAFHVLLTVMIVTVVSQLQVKIVLAMLTVHLVVI